MGHEAALRLLMRAIGVFMLLALPAVFMSADQMAAAHRWLGLGELPEAPIVGYLARSLSLFYVVLGALFLQVAGDLRRHGPIASFLGAAFMAFGVVVTGIDLGVGMPLYWTLGEGPPAFAVGLAMVWLNRKRSPDVDLASPERR